MGKVSQENTLRVWTVILKGWTHTCIHSQAKISNGAEPQAPLHDILKTPTSNILSNVPHLNKLWLTTDITFKKHWNENKVRQGLLDTTSRSRPFT